MNTSFALPVEVSLDLADHVLQEVLSAALLARQRSPVASY